MIYCCLSNFSIVGKILLQFANEGKLKDISITLFALPKKGTKGVLTLLRKNYEKIAFSIVCIAKSNILDFNKKNWKNLISSIITNLLRIAKKSSNKIYGFMSE